MTLGEGGGVEAGEHLSSYGDTMWSSDMRGAETRPWGTATPRGRSAPPPECTDGIPRLPFIWGAPLPG